MPKSSVPFSLILITSSLWVVMSHFARTQPDDQVAIRTVSSPFAGQLLDDERAQHIKDVLTEKGTDAGVNVIIESILCKGKTCTIEARARDNPALFQSALTRQLEKYPELGRRMDRTTAVENSGVAQFSLLPR